MILMFNETLHLSKQTANVIFTTKLVRNVAWLLPTILLILQVLMTPSQPFKLGPKTFHLLLDLFLYHDFSIVNFTRNFQVSCGIM